MEVVKETLNIAGLLTNVYAHRDLHTKLSSEPIVVLFFPWFFLHGRGSSIIRRSRRPHSARSLCVGRREASFFKAESPGLHSGYVRTLVGFLAARDGSQADRRWLSGWLTSGLAGPAEPWQENGGWTRELGMEL